MYILKNGQIEAHAPTMAEVKELYSLATGHKFVTGTISMDGEDIAEASRQELAELEDSVINYDKDAIHLDSIDGQLKATTTVIDEPAAYSADKAYKDGDSALFGDKVFTKYQGQWIDPSVIPPAELQQHEAEVSTDPKPSDVSSIAAVDVFKTAQVDTPASVVPPPPAASSPAPTNVPTPPAVSTAATAHASVELDKRGLPWDARIHSSSKAKLANGNWKLLRGVDAALVATVEAELYGAMAAPAATLVTKQFSTEEIATAFHVPLPPATNVPDAPADFTSLVMKLSEFQIKGRITKEQIAAAVNEHGLASLPLLSTRPDLVAQVWASVLKVLK